MKPSWNPGTPTAAIPSRFFPIPTCAIIFGFPIIALSIPGAKRRPIRRIQIFGEIRIDPQTGQPRGKPKRLTDRSGFVFSTLSATADGKQLTFINDHEQSDVYVAELDKNSTAIKPPLRLTLSDRIDWPGGWRIYQQ